MALAQAYALSMRRYLKTTKTGSRKRRETYVVLVSLCEVKVAGRVRSVSRYGEEVYPYGEGEEEPRKERAAQETLFCFLFCFLFTFGMS
jgi:hypothetical protein